VVGHPADVVGHAQEALVRRAGELHAAPGEQRDRLLSLLRPLRFGRRHGGHERRQQAAERPVAGELELVRIGRRGHRAPTIAPQAARLGLRAAAKCIVVSGRS